MSFISDLILDYKKIFFETNHDSPTFYDADYAKGIEQFSQNPRWTEEAKCALSRVSYERASRGLDVGCNMGLGTQHLAELSGLPFVGVDLSEQAIEIARTKFPEGACCYLHYDGNVLPFDDLSFDLIVSMHVIGHVARPDRFVSEIHRVMRPGGHLCVVTPSASYKVFALIDSIVTRYSPDLTIRRYYWRRGLYSVLSKAQFKDITIEMQGDYPILLRAFSPKSFGRMRLVAHARKNE